MSAQPQSLAKDAPHEIRFHSQTGRSRWDIAIHTVIRAEPSRLFHALTLPEYREAWFCPPEKGEAYSVTASQQDLRYSIHVDRREAGAMFISGSYLLLKPSELAFTWRKDEAARGPDTMVEIRLHNNAGRSGLRLYHKGFTSKAEGLWHQSMWSMSLGRLARLLETRLT